MNKRTIVLFINKTQKKIAGKSHFCFRFSKDDKKQNTSQDNGSLNINKNEIEL